MTMDVTKAERNMPGSCEEASVAAPRSLGRKDSDSGCLQGLPGPRPCLYWSIPAVSALWDTSDTVWLPGHLVI